MSDVVRIGSRASKLARTQVTEWLTPITRRFPDVRFKREVVLEGGDQDRVTATLAEVAKTTGGSAFSTNQEQALITGRVDVIVQSLKDLPTTVYEGTTLLAPPGPREDVRDVLCGATLDTLPQGARVGTGAPRRIGQLLALRPDLELVPIRGNVPGRLARATKGGLHAVVLAAAGLNRLGLMPEVHQILDPAVCPRPPDRARSASRSAPTPRPPGSWPEPETRRSMHASAPNAPCWPNFTEAAPFPSGHGAGSDPTVCCI
ncbi:hypothetical protein ACFV2X_04265 [Streptomyces sp. NPDC059679]|uniref:hypothetical protein n=1 Tax=Streptomyces sp. NPDC059679 TaxID=3346903 RepID=UPI0036BF1843